jgi:hypothetical protein
LSATLFTEFGAFGNSCGEIWHSLLGSQPRRLYLYERLHQAWKSGQVFRSLSILIDPENEFDAINISIHGIEPEHVAGASIMREVFPSVNEALAESIVVHHTHFDRVALCRAATKYGFPNLIWRTIGERNSSDRLACLVG